MEKARWCFRICNKFQDKNDFKEGKYYTWWLTRKREYNDY